MNERQRRAMFANMKHRRDYTYRDFRYGLSQGESMYDEDVPPWANNRQDDRERAEYNYNESHLPHLMNDPFFRKSPLPDRIVHPSSLHDNTYRPKESWDFLKRSPMREIKQEKK